MAEHYEDIVVAGEVVGRRLMVDGLPAPAEDRRVTQLAFRQRFTQAEMVAVELTAEPPVRGGTETEAAFQARRQLAATLRAMLADVAVAKYIDLDRPDTRAGVQQLEAVGLLAAGRAAVILDAPITEKERAPA